MVALTQTIENSQARTTASLVVQALITRISVAVNRPGADHPMLRPTVFVPVRRGDVLTYTDVVARKV